MLGAVAACGRTVGMGLDAEAVMVMVEGECSKGRTTRAPGGVLIRSEANLGK